MIENKLQYYQTYAGYKTQKDAHNIPNDSLVFVEDTKQVITHGEEGFGSTIRTEDYSSAGSADISLNDAVLIVEQELSETQKSTARANILDKETDQYAYSKLGRVILPKHVVDGHNTLTQDMFYKDSISTTEYDLTIDSSNAAVIDGTTYYYEEVSLTAGQKITLIDTTHCVLLNSDHSAILDITTITADSALTVCVASTATGTYSTAYIISVTTRSPRTDTIYVIEYDYTLGEDITVPTNCVLQFEGGSISGSNTLTYTNTLITGSWEKSISCVCAGTVANDIVNPLMYGAHINSTTEDSSAAIQAAINNNKKVEFTKGTYIIDAPIVLDGNYYNIDFSFSTLKKTSNATYNYTYKDIEYQDAAVIVYKPSSGYTSGYSILSNLIIDGVNKTNNITGIIARNNRAMTLNDIRIDRCKTGFIFGGFLNTYNKITCSDCELGFNLSDLMYSVFTECFNSVPNNDGSGYLITNCLNIEFNSCSSDNATNAAYYATDSKISLINCSCEVKTLCIYGYNSIITIVGGHFECYQYNSPNPLKYLQLNASKLYAKGTFFHWANYGSLTTYENSNQISATNGSYVDIEGTIEYVEGLKTLTYSADSLYINGVKAPHTSPITLPVRTLGVTANRPTLNDNDGGFNYYDTNLRKNIIWSGNRWEDENGFPAIPTVGTTTNRPTGIGSDGALDNNKDKGFCYFDTDLGKPIYATRIYNDGSVNWVDATGATV